MPGSNDANIEKELQRVFGPFESDALDGIEINAMLAYQDAVDTGLWIKDESSLITTVDPLEDALKLCSASVSDEIGSAK